MKFSERMGFVKVSDVFQTNSMNQELRNRIYNFIENSFSDENSAIIYQILHCEFFKLKQNTYTPYSNISFENSYDTSEWYIIYDLLEFIIRMYTSYSNFTNYVKDKKEQLIAKINLILEEERSGYRVINNLVTPIIDNNEIASIEEAINQQDNASIHLKTALQHLSNKQNPDYRNSIKESISAVEFVIRTITKESTLGKGLNKIQAKINLPTVLKDGFDKIYAYTNSEEGIRHALMDEPNLKLEDAKFMLVSCSAFTNYLKSKHLATSI